MKNLIILLAGVLSSVNLYAGNREKSPFKTFSFSASSVKEVEASSIGGSIVVDGNDKCSEVLVELYILCNPNWSDEKIKQTLKENFIVDVRVEKGKLYAVAKSKKSSRANELDLGFSFKITVPEKINSNLKTSLSEIQIRNLSGSHNIKTSGSSLTVENVSGSIAGKTSDGNVFITNANGNIEIITSRGDVTGNKLSGKIKLTTSGGKHTGDINAPHFGNIKLDNISGSVDARTSDSEINVNMLSLNEHVKLSNTGNIVISMPTGKGYNIKASSGQKIETLGLKDFKGKKEDTKIEGKIGDGGPKIEIKSSKEINLIFM